MNILREKICYNALLSVFRDGKYSAQALTEALSANSGQDEEFITRLFYGVLERNFTLEYIIDSLAEKKPKMSVGVLLKMGVYMVRYMNVADYAAVDKCVELTKILGKGGASGFINAVLRRCSAVGLPSDRDGGEIDFISVNCSLPKWLTGMLLKEYGASFIEELTSFEEFRTHIRLNDNLVNVKEFDKRLSELQDIDISKTQYGYYVTHNTLKKLLNAGLINENNYTMQSLASMAAVNCYARGLNNDSEVLDLCSAPGGKAIYLYQLTNAKITACDIHIHRLELIEKYARRMNAEINVVLNDACVEKKEWFNKFDCVICDVPCSGTGDLRSKPDVLLNRKFSDIAELSKLQSQILKHAANYVKKGGKLCYSTCSILKQENESVVNEFLKNNADFDLEDCSCFASELLPFSAKTSLRNCESKKTDRLAEGKNVLNIEGPFLKLYPHIHATDGFFAAAVRKKS